MAIAHTISPPYWKFLLDQHLEGFERKENHGVTARVSRPAVSHAEKDAAGRSAHRDASAASHDESSDHTEQQRQVGGEGNASEMASASSRGDLDNESTRSTDTKSKESLPRGTRWLEPVYPIFDNCENNLMLHYPNTYWDMTSMEEPPGPKPQHVIPNPGTPWPPSCLSKNRGRLCEYKRDLTKLPPPVQGLKSLRGMKPKEGDTPGQELWDSNSIQKIGEMTPVQRICYLSIEYDHDALDYERLFVRPPPQRTPKEQLRRWIVEILALRYDINFSGLRDALDSKTPSPDGGIKKKDCPSVLSDTERAQLRHLSAIIGHFLESTRNDEANSGVRRSIAMLHALVFKPAKDLSLEPKHVFQWIGLYVVLTLKSKKTLCSFFKTYQHDLHGFVVPGAVIKKIAPNADVQRLLRKHIDAWPASFSWRRKVAVWRVESEFVGLVEACEGWKGLASVE
ncbi:hypothetical protein K491DRAFT_718069 [Lophiostoma macrostomum CBS 122681]|uniref:Uncharacterized protein n=1 Tax=Lophiostoma macrostomum CBS 122681 TaxID=1314788 RepID=A0A6A6T128_9PLEO|nr:hypothetical protein K491DRAFT_718069 [Lophiostoma macrostomum CBS 122681]